MTVVTLREVAVFSGVMLFEHAPVYLVAVFQKAARHGAVVPVNAQLAAANRFTENQSFEILRCGAVSFVAAFRRINAPQSDAALDAGNIKCVAIDNTLDGAADYLIAQVGSIAGD